MLGEIQAQQVFAFQVLLDAELLFGREAGEWTHEERCRRLAEFYDGQWREKGGEGHHPASQRYVEAAGPQEESDGR